MSEAKKKTVSLKDLKTGIEHDLGARLSYHLNDLKNQFGKDTEIHKLASQALKEKFDTKKTGLDDPFTQLGVHLKAIRHDLGKAYNWDKIHRGVQLDKAVKDYTHQRIKSGESKNLFRKTAETFANVLGLHKNKKDGHDEFWQGLREHVANKLGGNVNDENLYRSLRRNAHTEDDANDIADNAKKRATVTSKTGEGTYIPPVKSASLIPAKAPTVKGVKQGKGEKSGLKNNSNVESYARQFNEMVLQYERCNAHCEYIDDMKQSGKSTEEIKEGLMHSFHMTDADASKALIKYGMPDKDKDPYNEEYGNSITPEMPQ